MELEYYFHLELTDILIIFSQREIRRERIKIAIVLLCCMVVIDTDYATMLNLLLSHTRKIILQHPYNKTYSIVFIDKTYFNVFLL